MDIIKLKAPAAFLKGEKPNEVSIALNVTDVKGLHEMFADLEKKSPGMGVEKIGVTSTTMQDIYHA